MTTAGPRRSLGPVRLLSRSIAVLALLCLSACASNGGAVPQPPRSASTAPGASTTETPRPSTASAQALLLVPTIWRVRDAAGEAPGTWIRFDSGVDLIRPRGDVFLSWSTHADALLTHVDGWSMRLGTTPPAVPWLTSTVRFEREGGAWVLTDASGHRTARLVRDGAPPPSSRTQHDVPEVDDRIRAQHADAVIGGSAPALPPGAAVGTWGLPGVAARDASLTLTRSGTWSARTSCAVLGRAQGGSGAYRLLPSGVVLVTESAIGGTGCTEPERRPAPDSAAILDFFSAGSIRIEDARMTVFDRAGKRLGTLVPKG